MSHPQKVKPVIFFVAKTGKDEKFRAHILPKLEDLLGIPIIYSKPYDFSKYTNYYEKEMGFPLQKIVFFFEGLRDPSFLVDLKHYCYGIEQELAEDGKRCVNLDPGYLTLSKVILSTFKDYSHRIYLGNSVFAEIEYIYRDGSYQPLPWTYPDYQEKELVSLFNRAREIYKEKLKCYSI